jgi:hypothetical protein
MKGLARMEECCERPQARRLTQSSLRRALAGGMTLARIAVSLRGMDLSLADIWNSLGSYGQRPLGISGDIHPR